MADNLNHVKDGSYSMGLEGLIFLNAVRDTGEERSKAYVYGTTSSTGAGNDEMRQKNRSRGFAMVEVIVGIGIAAVLLSTFAALVTQSAKISRANKSELVATLYLREAIETVKDLEQWNWAAITSCANPCYPKPVGNVWTLSALSADGILDGGNYTRNMTVSDVLRDGSNAIVESGGTSDPNTKKVVANIAWNNGITNRLMTLETYVYNLP